ncbi:MAG: chemotaxis protein MotA [Kiritimatiellia bacterium]|jgi:chemotaxis protein MotA
MDLGTIIGLVVAFALLVVAILLGGSLLAFIDLPSIVLVIGCTTAAIFIAFPVGKVKGGIIAAKAAFFASPPDSGGTIKLLSELSNRARREGLLSLEAAAEQTEDDFLKRGLLMMADGHEAAVIETVLYDEIGKIGERHAISIGVWDNIGSFAPAMGMLGTLVGLVLMLGNLDDPSTIGPKMAIALLTTFYGAIIANLVGIPIANKLRQRSTEEVEHKELTAAGLLSILAGENPRFMVERLNSTLPPAKRFEEAA